MTDTPPTGVLVDSNVLLDLFTDDPVWATWSEARLAEAFDAGQAVINPIVYAEISVAFERIETLEATLPPRLGREDLPWEAAFLAGKCFVSTADAAAGDDHRWPISTSVPTPPSPAARY
jgi:predicted nucleic acid-binding protein